MWLGGMLIANSNRQYGIFDEGIKVTEGIVHLWPRPQMTITDKTVVLRVESRPGKQLHQHAVLRNLFHSHSVPSQKQLGKKTGDHTKCNYYLSRTQSICPKDTLQKITLLQAFSQKPSV